MKKIFAVLLVLAIMLSLAACSSKEQAAADQWLEDYEDLMDDYETAANQLNVAELDRLGKKLDDMLKEYDEIFDALLDKDVDAAREFLNEYTEISSRLRTLY